jgi:hypothetical protein
MWVPLLPVIVRPEFALLRQPSQLLRCPPSAAEKLLQSQLSDAVTLAGCWQHSALEKPLQAPPDLTCLVYKLQGKMLRSCSAD